MCCNYQKNYRFAEDNQWMFNKQKSKERTNLYTVFCLSVSISYLEKKLSSQGVLWVLGTRKSLTNVLKILFVYFVINRILTQKLVNYWNIEERTGLFTNSAPQLCRPSTHSLPSYLLSISALLFTSLSESRSACLLDLSISFHTHCCRHSFI